MVFGVVSTAVVGTGKAEHEGGLKFPALLMWKAFIVHLRLGESESDIGVLSIFMCKAWITMT